MRHLILHSGKIFDIRRLIAFLCIASLLLGVNVQNVAAEGEGAPELTAASALLMENSTGKILYEKNIHERRPMASITKIMTMLLAMEEIAAGRMGYDDVITGSAHAKSMGGSTIFLDEGEQMSVRDIMKGIAVASGNDAAVAMAEHISGTEAAFVERMNQRASQLGMADTHFVNSNGLDTQGHYSSAYDIAIMSRELLKYPDIHNFTTIWMDTLRGGKSSISNTNKLIRFYDGATGLKTGSTTDAGFCVSATAKRDGMHLIAVIMAAPRAEDRVSDAGKLLDYGFASYSIIPVSNAGDSVGELPISKGMKAAAGLVVTSPFEVLAKKGENPQIEMKPVYTSDFVAPITVGDTAGVMEYYINGEKAGESSIAFSESIEKAGALEFFVRMLKLLFAGGVQRT